MLFSSLINQQKSRDALLQMVKQQRLAHALLLREPEGSGGLLLAIAFATYLMCEQPGDNDACGQCPSCRKMAQLIHPDVHFAFPVVSRKPGSEPTSDDYMQEWREFVREFPYGDLQDWLQLIHAENRQANVTAAECREIVRKLSLKSFEGRYKILIFWLPEYLGQQGNRLLKLVEEPPDDTLMLFVSQQPQRILSTIASRLQTVQLSPLPAEEITQALITRSQADPQMATRIGLAAGGNYRMALRLLHDAHADWLEMLRSWLNAIAKQQIPALVQWIDEMGSNKNGREQQKFFLQYFLNLVEKTIQAHYLLPEQLHLPEAEQDFVNRLKSQFSFSQLCTLSERLNAAIYQIERNAYAKLVFHALTLYMQELLVRPQVNA
ncbi:DNA polymerase-3 subunit delta' [Thermoflavifilum aggregans]|uniref:DNA polymerase-3 subunit delta n=1 Tax=Thermoflavifilum aggregans TaxID=454188 RepID=A0A2M9CSE1_9BACT|nr:hypothetical protein [Thermoflavifilum aggregans]PJJ74728.1 DNA polymerase-3 subunit delta' [Thermoflavifilum aggregans]